MVVWHPSLVDEDLVEQRATGHLTQRADLDTGLAHREHEVRDASVFREVGICSGDENSVVGPLAERRPDLLPRDHPFVAVAFGAGLQPGEVGPGAGLGEQLAPAVFAVEDARHESLDQLVGSVCEQGRGCQHHAEPGGRPERSTGDHRARQVVRP